MIPKHIHDRFFKEAFSRPEVAADFIQAYLPASFSEQLKTETLTRQQDSHIDDELSQHYVDLLFSAQFGNEPIVIALLFEHKSYPEEYPHFQLMRYLQNYWSNQLKEKQKLCPVIPIVIYHGQAKWKYRPLSNYFEQSSSLLAEFLPDFRYYLINLTNDPENRFSLLESSYAKLTAGLLKTIRKKQQLKNMLEELKQVIAQLADEALGEQFIKTAFLYVSWGSSLTTAEAIVIFRSISHKTDQLVMSAAETWIQEGVDKATLKHIKGLLGLGMDVQTIATAFEMPPKTVEQYISLIQKEKKQ